MVKRFALILALRNLIQAVNINDGLGCCSQSFKNCDVTWCGTTEAECIACAGKLKWLEDGPLTDCMGNANECSADTDCCDGLVCLGNACTKSIWDYSVDPMEDYKNNLGYPLQYPFERLFPVEEIPQFVIITIDDNISSERVKPTADYLMSIQTPDARGCTPKITMFVSFDYTDCGLLHELYRAKHEMATHTLHHEGYPSKEQIDGGFQGQAECGTPFEEVIGFRTPYLTYDQRVLDDLYTLQGEYGRPLYDSSVVLDGHAPTDYGRSNHWPWKWEHAKEVIYNRANPGANAAPHIEWHNFDPAKASEMKGMWEITMPLYYEPGTDTHFYNNMDYPFSHEIMWDNFNRRYNGNRAPFHINCHSPWLVTNGASLKEWIEELLGEKDDVFFITNVQLLEYMENPVPLSEYKQQRICDEPDYEDAYCFPPNYACQWWSQDWDGASCSCVCKEGFCLRDGACINYGCEVEPTPVQAPVAAPVPVQSPEQSPMDEPAAPPETPVAPPVYDGPGCCSNDFKTCITWCGTGEDACDACGVSDPKKWLSDGALVNNNCSPRWSSCTSDDMCCPGLACLADGASRSCLPGDRSDPVESPGNAPVSAPNSSTEESPVSSSSDEEVVFPFSRLPFNDVIPTSEIPQFITITFDDSVNPYTSYLVSKIARTLDPHTGCNLKSTFYVSIEGNTKCEFIQGLRKGGHEIGTHTLDHIGLPSIAQIQGAVDWLKNECGVPAEEMRGFRTPFLNWDDSTLQNLHQLGFLYDSSIGPTDHTKNLRGENHTWPFTLEQPNINQFETVKPSVKISPAPGLWEIPMWSLYDANNQAEIPMDYPNPKGGDAVIRELIDPNFLKHYNGNRAPFGLFFHASWLVANGEAFATWIQDVMDAYDDVFFVTSYEVLQWMESPVPASEYVHSCPEQKVCFAPQETGCLFGTFNAETCECDCMAPYCKGPDGACTEYANCPAGPTTPGASPVASPVTPYDGPGCCSQSFKNCDVGWCGTTEAECNACADLVRWLEDGAVTNCMANYAWGCSADTDCCDGLVCLESSCTPGERSPTPVGTPVNAPDFPTEEVPVSPPVSPPQPLFDMCRASRRSNRNSR